VDNPNSRAALVVRVYEGMKDDPRDRRPDAEKRSAAREFVDQLAVEKAAGKEKPRGGKPPKPTSEEQGDGKPAGDKAGGKSEAMAIPEELKGEPDGTVVSDDAGKQYEIRDGKLVPMGK
jgi:hypothetical protein